MALLYKTHAAAGVFVDLSKTFDLVNHKKNILFNRKVSMFRKSLRRRFLQVSRLNILLVATGFPKGSVVIPLLFLIICYGKYYYE